MSNKPGLSEKSDFAQIEEQILGDWQKDKTFEQSLKNRKGKKLFSFYDGPPFANGKPHWGGMMTSVLKDAITRYKTMRGYYVPRRFGWDCHGLPPELEVEKQLDVHGKKAIQEYGVDKFVNTCRESVLKYTGIWQEYVSRIGRWVDFKDDYRTMDTSYTESVWWAFKKLYEHGLVYESERVVPYSYGAQTPLSNFETRLDDSFREREDIAATVKFELQDGRRILGWTTTPWTLPSNLLLAVNRELQYITVELDNEQLVLAQDALKNISKLANAKVVKIQKGSEFEGLMYRPIFDYFLSAKNAFRIVAADFVTADDGVGIVHLAPGHGEDDYWVGKKEGVPIISPVDDQGRFTSEVKDYAGRLVFDANNEIVADLDHRHQLFSSEIYTHSYPHCWRTDVPIIYRTMNAWFVDVPKIKKLALEENQKINWFPEHVKNGAFGNWLENAREWNISRNRYWGAPIPVWKTDDGEVIVIGSIKELKEYAGEKSLPKDLHKPWIDQIEITTRTGKIARRIEDVFDCWFESGSMPFASVHYPFENKEVFESSHPGDFITEYTGQTRGWFYTLHIMSVALFGKPAFKNSVAHGIILGSDGRKMSKRLGNYPPLSQVFNKQGADAIRLYLLGSSLFSGETAAFDERALTEAQRNLVQRLFNSYKFFKMYAQVDDWKPPKELVEPDDAKNILDKWIISRLNETISESTACADRYDTPGLIRALHLFIDDLSNWYIRRSRRRFWRESAMSFSEDAKSEDDKDKLYAYWTLWYILIKTSQLLGPWAPFISEYVYKDLVGGTDLPGSVHLTDWPKAAKVNIKLIDQMKLARDIINEGLAQRAKAGIKVRQPLQEINVVTSTTIPKDLTVVIKEEVNVKNIPKISIGKHQVVEINTTLTPQLKREGSSRDLIRHIQSLRKEAGLQVDDRILLSVESQNEEMDEMLSEHGETIKQETLATDLAQDKNYSYSKEITIDGENIIVSLKKS